MSVVNETWITIDGLKVRYLSAGASENPIVLLLHGAGIDCADLSWRHTIPALSPCFRVIAPNFPGYGGSEALGGSYVVADFGQWLVRFMGKVGIEKADVAGISMGGGVALWLALNHPSQVCRLAPINSYGLMERIAHQKLSFLLSRLPLTGATYWLMGKSWGFSKLALKYIISEPSRIPDELVSEAQYLAAKPGSDKPFQNFQIGEIGWRGVVTNFSEDLHRIHHSTLFIHGKKDSLVPLAAVEHAVRTMPHAALEVLDCGHWPIREVPDLFNSVLLRFLTDDVQKPGNMRAPENHA